MKKNSLTIKSFTFLVLLAFAFNGRCQKKDTPGDFHPGSPKLKKNHFSKSYPQDFFFVQCGLQSQSGNMWFGAAGNGIYTYNGNSFFNYTSNDGLSHDDILCCKEDKTGNIWFGTRNGIIRYKPSAAIPAKKDFRNFYISENTINDSSRLRLPRTFERPGNFVWNILEDKSGKIWFATNSGIYVHNPSTDYDGDIPLFTRFLDNKKISNENNLHLKDVLSMMEDKDGNIWFASGFMDGEGICRFDGHALTNFKPDSLDSFRAIAKDKNGNLLFLNMFKGLYLLEGKTFSNYSEKIGVQGDTIVSVKVDKAGNIWLARGGNNFEDGGVWRYDGTSLKLFTKKNGLSHNCVFLIVEDKEGAIWFGTRNTGLCRYDGKTFVDFTGE